MPSSETLVIENGVLKKYAGNSGKVLIPEGVKVIGKRAFAENNALTDLSFPESLERIEAYAFADCTGLGSLSFPKGLQFLGKMAFSRCTGLGRVSFEGEEVRVSEGVFFGCRRIRISASARVFARLWKKSGLDRELHLMASLERGKHLRPSERDYIRTQLCVFYQTLKRVDKLSLLAKALDAAQFSPGELDLYLRIGELDPEFSTRLLEYKKEKFPPQVIAELEEICVGKELGLIPRTVADWKKLYRYRRNGDEVILERYLGREANPTIPQRIGRGRVTAVENGAFYGNSFLESVVLPEGICRIGDWAFYKCGKLESVVFPETLVSIGDSAFCGCSALTDLICSVPLPRAGARAFSDCKGLAGQDGFVVFGDVLYDYFGADREICIPEGIRSVEKFAFRNCAHLERVRFSSTVEYIGDQAFENCHALKQVIFPEGLRRIGEQAFCHCTALEEILLPDGVEEVGNAAFWDCASLSRVEIPEQLEKIGRGVFGRCFALADGDGFVTVNGVLHVYLNNQIRLTVPEGVKRILPGAFVNCYSLALCLPESLEKIGSALHRCGQLTALTLPRGMKRLSKGELDDCRELKDLFIPGSGTKIEAGALCGTDLTVHAPSGSCAEQYAKENGIKFKAE